MQQKGRYSDEELAEFKVLVENKLVKAQRQLDLLQKQIQETAENSDDDFGTDWIDDCNVHTQLEMLSDMASRQRKYINNLENALLRIKNKSYGICEVSGELIDKRRLIAVPTTTKSLDAKASLEARSRLGSPGSSENREKEEEMDTNDSKVSNQEQKPKVITRIIRKSDNNTIKKEEIPFRAEDAVPFWDEDEFSEDPEYLDPDDLPDDDGTFEMD